MQVITMASTPPARRAKKLMMGYMAKQPEIAGDAKTYTRLAPNFRRKWPMNFI